MIGNGFRRPALAMLILAVYPWLLACGDGLPLGIDPTVTSVPASAAAPTGELVPEPPKFRLSWTVEPAGAGNVAVKPAALSFEYAPGATVQVRAIPEDRFTSWGGDLAGSDNPASVVMDGDKTLVAVFAAPEPEQASAASANPTATPIATAPPIRTPTPSPRPAATPLPRTEPTATPLPAAVTGLVRGGTISGRIRDADTREPMRDVYVRAENDETGASNDDTTGADGIYEIAGLAPGIYRIKAESQRDGYINEYFDDSLTYDDAKLVRLERAEAVVAVDFDLGRGSSVSGSVTDAENGSPVAGVGIIFEPTFGADNAYATTDADGRYEIVGALAPGPYYVAVETHDLVYIDQFYDGQRSREDADRIMVGPQEVLEDIDFSLEVGGTITGVVTDAATGRPISNVSTHAEPQQEGPSADAGTGFGGEYTLSGLAPGRYRIRAWANDQGYASRYFGQSPGLEIEAVLIVGSELLAGIDIVLGRGATVSGRVTDAATGRPVAGIGVRAAPVDGGRHEWAYTESDGTYALRGLPPSSFYLSTANGGEHGYVEQFYDGHVKQDQADIVVLASEASVTDVNFALRTGATISGRVIEAATGRSLGSTDIGAEPDGVRRQNKWDKRGAFKACNLDANRLRQFSDLPTSVRLDSFASPPVSSPVWRLGVRGTYPPA